MGSSFDEGFDDVGVSGAILAAKRPGFARLLAFVRKGDTLHVYAVDRLGRDALDVQSTVRALGQGCFRSCAGTGRDDAGGRHGAPADCRAHGRRPAGG